MGDALIQTFEIPHLAQQQIALAIVDARQGERAPAVAAQAVQTGFQPSQRFGDFPAHKKFHAQRFRQIRAEEQRLFVRALIVGALRQFFRFHQQFHNGPHMPENERIDQSVKSGAGKHAEDAAGKQGQEKKGGCDSAPEGMPVGDHEGTSFSAAAEASRP